MIIITHAIHLNDWEVQFNFIRSPGPGGQNVNKTASGVQLRFNIAKSSLPEPIRARLLMQLNRKLTQQNEILIKATRFRTQERNRQDAIERLKEIIIKASYVPKKRKRTKPTLAAKEQRITTKKLRGKIKGLRQKKINLGG